MLLSTTKPVPSRSLGLQFSSDASGSERIPASTSLCHAIFHPDFGEESGVKEFGKGVDSAIPLRRKADHWPEKLRKIKQSSPFAPNPIQTRISKLPSGSKTVLKLGRLTLARRSLMSGERSISMRGITRRNP